MDRNLMKKHALKIENLFRTNSVSLFIGTGVELCDISEEITSLQWSAVFTTQTDTNIAYKFKNERRNPIVCVGDDRPEKLLDIVSTPIFFLNSKNNEETSTALKEIGLFDDEYETLCPWAKVMKSGREWPDELTDAAVELFESEKNNREQRRKKRGKKNTADQ